MHVRVFTLRFSPLSAAFDDEELQTFIRDKEIIRVEDHFFVHDERPYLALVVLYHLVPVAADTLPRKRNEERHESWRNLLTEADYPVFNALREWRAERAKQRGVPPYVIGTNQQLAEMVKRKPRTLSDLAGVDGFGKAKLERHGREILSILVQESKLKPDAAAPLSENPHEPAEG
jgi:superfamily II DNA helicase RecQ